MVHLVITGGLGFLGVQAARRFLRSGLAWSPSMRCAAPIVRLTLFDAMPVPEDHLPEELKADPRLQVASGDITMPGVAAEVLDGAAYEGDVAVIHLASMVSGNSETNPDAAWQVNVEGQRAVLDALRECAPGARFLFTSSTAALGPVAPGAPPPNDLTKLLPQNTYGFHKAVCELMLNDYSRRGWVDGRGLRLPVIAVRPGAPNAAATGAWSSVVREPLNGQDCNIPIPADVPMPVASYQTAVHAMELLMNEVPAEGLGADRVLMLPSLQLSPGELAEAAAALADEHGLPLGRVIEQPEELPTRVVRSMGACVDGGRALALGLPQDESAESIVKSYAAEHVLERADDDGGPPPTSRWASETTNYE